MPTIRIITLLLATITMGLTAGAFALYSHTIMPGLRTTDDRTFVASFQAMDRAIINPWFIGGCFLGALVATAASAALTFRTAAFGWVVAALVLYAIAVVLTVAINVPLNDALKAAGDPNSIDVAAARAAFKASVWEMSNHVRTALSLVAFGLLGWALAVTER
ncbi:DUF1772 domain-containing protein [Smaragdicoccus niigatensis]|uniref:anthrone oxygenase family protein n=1 Tax=Smaragdicoccus niigatensis TaxID=359359 RepID=UPI00036FB32B|nr:DUF1772 domain-containing protein [Smaragdicoccus niigatensis]